MTNNNKEFMIRDEEHIIRDGKGHILAKIKKPKLSLKELLEGGSTYCKKCGKVVDFKDCEIIEEPDN